MKPILLICLGVFILLLFLGWSLWIGVGLSLYWISGIYSMKTIFKWWEEEAEEVRKISYADEWLFRLIVVFFGGFFFILLGYVYIDRMFKKQEKEEKSFKSWFE